MLTTFLLGLFSVGLKIATVPAIVGAAAGTGVGLAFGGLTGSAIHQGLTEGK